MVLAALATRIIIENGFLAALDDDRPAIRTLIDIPFWNGEPDWIDWRFSYRPETKWDGRSIMRKALDNFAATHGIKEQLKLTRRSVDVKVVEVPSIPSFDVVICSRVGYWSPYRGWPHFPELKRRLTLAGISWFDLSETNTTDNECLNYVGKAKLYLGLETGTSHFVASVARRGLIIQSGYSSLDYWSTYGYDEVSVPVPCRNCFLDYSQRCPNAHVCMVSVTAEMVFRSICVAISI